MIEWSINLECGCVDIDEQHKKLIEIMNKIAYHLENKNYEFHHISQIVTEVDNYITEHFSFEEKLMRENKYPNIEDHLFEHHYFRLKMKDMNIYDIENKEDFYNSMLYFISNWLFNHIMMVDKKLGEFLSVIK